MPYQSPICAVSCRKLATDLTQPARQISGEARDKGRFSGWQSICIANQPSRNSEPARRTSPIEFSLARPASVEISGNQLRRWNEYVDGVLHSSKTFLISDREAGGEAEVGFPSSRKAAERHCSRMQGGLCPLCHWEEAGHVCAVQSRPEG